MSTVERRTKGLPSTEARVLVQDVIPYETPQNLADLRGPGTGILTLPQHIYWGPEANCDLDEHEGVIKAYQAVLREGTRPDQEVLLNADVLKRMWGDLVLPVRCRNLWEIKSPHLAQRS